MGVTGKVKTIFTDKEKTEAIFPRTKVSAVSDDNGVGLNALLTNMLYAGSGNGAVSTIPVNADTLDGRLAADYATQSFVSTEIAKAQLASADGNVTINSIQSDWSQGNPDALDYVKNRTHYDQETVVLFENNAVVFEYDSVESFASINTSSLVAGKTYEIAVDGVTTQMECPSSGRLQLGVDVDGLGGVYDMELDCSSGLLFCSCIAGWTDEPHTHSIKISEKRSLKQLDEKFIPNTIARVANNAGAHNTIYRGKYLGDNITQEQFAAMTNGTFEDLFIGDYWTIGGINFRIAAFDYYYGTGGGDPLQKHHAVLVPDSVSALFPGIQMNATATTTGGYLGSVMRQNNLDYAYKLIQGFLGDHLILHKNYFSEDNAGNGHWTEGTLELMTEQNVYGSSIFADKTKNCLRTIDNTQYPLFRYRPDLICDPNCNYWLRDIVSDTEFAQVCRFGNCDKASAEEYLGVRFAFLVG